MILGFVVVSGLPASGKSGHDRTLIPSPEFRQEMQHWPFESASNTACITVREIMAGTRPILEAHRDADGDWQFLPGIEVSEADAMVVSLKELIERDESVAAVADMKPGSFATRASQTAPWQRREAGPHDE